MGRETATMRVYLLLRHHLLLLFHGRHLLLLVKSHGNLSQKIHSNERLDHQDNKSSFSKNNGFSNFSTKDSSPGQSASALPPN